jgi:hypothetical protein
MVYNLNLLLKKRSRAIASIIDGMMRVVISGAFWIIREINAIKPAAMPMQHTMFSILASKGSVSEKI